MHPLSKVNFGNAVGQIAVEFNNGNSVVAGSIVKQTGSHRYVVTDGVNDYTVQLAQANTSPAPGEMSLLVYPWANGAVSNTPEHARNLSTNLVYTIEGNKYHWTFNAAVQAGQCNIAQIPPAAPVVAAFTANATANTATNINLTSHVTGSFTSVAVATGPSHGNAVLTAGVVVYTPTTGYTGADSFTYTASGAGGTSSPATVTLNVH